MQITKRVLVVEDHPITRFGIVALIRESAGFSVCGEAVGVVEAVEQFEQTKPDLVLMDLRLPNGHGVTAIERIMRIDKSARIIVLTTYEGDEDIYQALQAGAKGYLIKGMPHSTLVQAMTKVCDGTSYLPPPILRTLHARTVDRLSSRERAVLKRIVAGLTNREIGDELNITEATVKGHVTQILLRLGVSDRTQAAVAALRRGLEHI